jgi:hypothetical protein
MLARRAPLLGVVLGSQLVGIVAALVLGVARGEPVPQGTDLVWSVVGGMLGVIGITALYRGLAVGRMGVVAPTTGVLAAIVPVVVGFALEGLPAPAVVTGIAVALVAVVLVTRSPGHEGAARPACRGGWSAASRSAASTCASASCRAPARSARWSWCGWSRPWSWSSSSPPGGSRGGCPGGSCAGSSWSGSWT